MNLNVDNNTLIRHTLVDSNDPLAIELAERLEDVTEWEIEVCEKLDISQGYEMLEMGDDLKEAEKQVEEMEKRLQKMTQKYDEDYISVHGDWEEWLDVLEDLIVEKQEQLT